MGLTGTDMSPADIAAVTNCNNNGFGFGGEGGIWWLVVLFLFAGMFGGYGNGFGGGGGATGVNNGYILASDFATIQRQLSDGFNAQERRTDAIINGICDLGYTSQSLINGVNQNVSNGFYNTLNAINTNGYETRLAAKDLQANMQACCCDIREGIQANTTQGVMNTNAIQQQLSACCCEAEKTAMQNRFDMAQYNCSTLQAIDKLGDRIINHLVADRERELRDENQALRDAARRSEQNAYLLGQIRPAPVPAYNVPNPFGVCGCGC